MKIKNEYQKMADAYFEDGKHQRSFGTKYLDFVFILRLKSKRQYFPWRGPSLQTRRQYQD